MKATTVTAYDEPCPMNYPGFVFRELRTKGYTAEALLGGTGLTEARFQDPNSRVEFATLRLFVLNALKATGDPHLGPRLALSFEASYIGPPAYAAMNAPCFSDGLDVLCRFLHLTFPAIEVAPASRTGGLKSGETELRLRPRLSLGDLEYFVIGSALLVLNNLLKDMLRMPLVASRCDVTFARPIGWTGIARDISRVPVRFEAPETRIVFPATLLHRPLPAADPINHQRLVAICERFAAEAQPAVTRVNQVLSFLEKGTNVRAPLADAAAAMGCSERALRRQLERSGTSYRKLSEQCLEQRARHMLANTTLPINVIAHELGYDTPSNFARGFKRWTGETPRAFREQAGIHVNSGRK